MVISTVGGQSADPPLVAPSPARWVSYQAAPDNKIHVAWDAEPDNLAVTWHLRWTDEVSAVYPIIFLILLSKYLGILIYLRSICTRIVGKDSLETFIFLYRLYSWLYCHCIVLQTFFQNRIGIFFFY